MGTNINSISATRRLSIVLCLVGGVTCLAALAPKRLIAQQTVGKTPGSFSVGAKTFDTPQKATGPLVDAAEKFDVDALEEIFGSDGDDIALSGEYVQDRRIASDFAAQALKAKRLSTDQKDATRAFLLTGNDDRPFPGPLVKQGGKWSFDVNAGRQELLYRRIGSNELDAIGICRGYVEAQREYALKRREGYDVNQYAQRIIRTPRKQHGLAWHNPDGSWGGQIGENIARTLEQG
jgi:hypothetical protein